MAQNVTYWMNKFLNFKFDKGCVLVQNRPPVPSDLGGDALDLPVVVLQVGFVLDGVPDVCGLLVRRDLRWR